MYSPMLRVLSLNLNGIRSAASKGLFEWMAGHNADVLCLQENLDEQPLGRQQNTTLRVPLGNYRDRANHILLGATVPPEGTRHSEPEQALFAQLPTQRGCRRGSEFT